MTEVVTDVEIDPIPSVCRVFALFNWFTYTCDVCMFVEMSENAIK
jgi:hypothetical protein